MPKETIYQRADLPVAYMYQAIAFMRTEWPSIFQGEDQFMMETYPSFLSPVHFIVAEGDALISYAEVLRLDFPHREHIYRIYGFGNLFTFQPYCGQGYGKQVTSLATDFIMKSDIDGAILFCDTKLTSFYEQFGWRKNQSPTRIGTPDDYEIYETERMILPVSDKCQKHAQDFDRQPVYVESPW